MLQTATVIAILENGIAQVSVKRASACGHDCTSCGACGIMDKPLVVEADNAICAKVGDTVEIESETQKVLYLASIVYLVPVLLFFILYFSASAIFEKEMLSMLFGGIGFALGLGLAVLCNRREAKSKTVECRIVRVL